MAAQRYSRQRELIFETVCASTAHPTAEMVHAALKGEHPSLSLGTVYRNLHLLADQGKLRRMPFPVERFDGRVEPHTHFCCRECGGVFDLDAFDDSAVDLVQADRRAALAAPEFHIEGHDLTFYGLCPHCAEKNNR